MIFISTLHASEKKHSTNFYFAYKRIKISNNIFIFDIFFFPFLSFNHYLFDRILSIRHISCSHTFKIKKLKRNEHEIFKDEKDIVHSMSSRTCKTPVVFIRCVISIPLRRRRLSFASFRFYTFFFFPLLLLLVLRNRRTKFINKRSFLG